MMSTWWDIAVCNAHGFGMFCVLLNFQHAVLAMLSPDFSDPDLLGVGIKVYVNHDEEMTLRKVTGCLEIMFAILVSCTPSSNWR
jgi:hypothetical protein